MIDLDVIWRTVAQASGVPEELVRSDGTRGGAAHTARQVAMALAREMTPLALQEIGRHFGLDASSVTWAARKVAKRRAEPQFAKRLDRITRQLHQIAEERTGADPAAPRPGGAPSAPSAPSAKPAPTATPARSVVAEVEAERVMASIEYLASWQPARLRRVLSRLYGRDKKTRRLAPGGTGEQTPAPGGAAAAGGGRRARPCLSCGKSFPSAGAHNRLCARCVNSPAAGLPAQFT